MRKLKLQVQLSVDGYMADVNGKTDWMLWNWSEIWNWDEELKTYFINLKSTVDCILLSRKMAAEGFISHWEKVAANVANDQSAFAKKIAAAQKVVFTKTLKQSDEFVNTWSNTTLAQGNLFDEVSKLKNQQGKDMIVYGGVSFVASLIKANLIDEFHLFLNPVLLGKGLSPFNKLQQLDLIQSKSFTCGIVTLKYVPKK